MEYTTKDLSRILDVSTNTIRRFEGMGYLSSDRNEQNNYRKFTHSDVEKLMYVAKYRKVGFGHDDIGEILQGDLESAIERFQQKKDEIDAQIAHYQAVSHMLKDDIMLMKRVEEYGSDVIELECSPMHYVLYQKRGVLCEDKAQSKALHKFMSTCPEFEYIYLFEQKDMEAGKLVYSEGVAANQKFTSKYNVDVSSPVESYERRPCILQFMRLPLYVKPEEYGSAQEMHQQLFGAFYDYMDKHDLVQAGDALGLKLGFAKEDDREWQYVLMHMPVEKKNKKNEKSY